MVKPGQLKIIAAMPAYNEEKYIGTMVLKTRQYVDEVIIVDDGSTDNTSKVAQLAGATVVRHSKNRGYGAAIQSILTEARKRSPDALVLIDADYQHDPADIPNLIKPISDGYDFVIGSRKLKKNHIPLYRRFGQKILRQSTQVLSGKSLSDTESGFRVFSRKAIDTLELKENGMAISAETVAEAATKGLKVAEVPISIKYTEDGSTLNPLAHGFGVLTRIVAMISERKPGFFFGLGGATFTILGIIAGIRVLHTLAAQNTLPVGTALISVLFLIIGIFSIFTGIILHTIVKRKD